MSEPFSKDPPPGGGTGSRGQPPPGAPVPEQPDDNREPALQPPSSETTVGQVGDEEGNQETESSTERQLHQEEDVRFVRHFTDYQIEQYLPREDDVGPDSRHSPRSASLSMGPVSSIQYTVSITAPSHEEPGDLPTVGSGASGGTSARGGGGASSAATARSGAESTARRPQHVNIVVMLNPTASGTDKSRPSPSAQSSPKKFKTPVPRAKSSFEVGSLDKSHKPEFSRSGGAKKCRSVNLEHIKEKDVAELVRFLNAAFAAQRTDSTTMLSLSGVLPSSTSDRGRIRFDDETITRPPMPKPDTQEEAVQVEEPPKSACSTGSQTEGPLSAGSETSQQVAGERARGPTERVYLLSEEQVRQAFGSDDVIVRFPHMDVPLRRVSSDRGKTGTSTSDDSGSRAEIPRWLQEFFTKSDSSVALRSRRSPDAQGSVAPIIEEAEVSQTAGIESRQPALRENALVELKDEAPRSTLLVERSTPQEMQLTPAEVVEETKEELSGGLFPGTWESDTEDTKKLADEQLEERRPRDDALTVDAVEKEDEATLHLAQKPAEEAPHVEARVWTAESGLEESISEDELLDHDAKKGKKTHSKKAATKCMSLVVIPTPDEKIQSPRHSIDLTAKDSFEGMNAIEGTVTAPLTQQEYPAITYDVSKPPESAAGRHDAASTERRKREKKPLTGAGRTGAMSDMRAPEEAGTGMRKYHIPDGNVTGQSDKPETGKEASGEARQEFAEGFPMNGLEGAELSGARKVASHELAPADVWPEYGKEARAEEGDQESAPPKPMPTDATLVGERRYFRQHRQTK
ncbi:hypothetical protein HPB52_003909 [Rhipicephalus sanguineus]|uniref:Uncharacterized protein n=1 Tax=Rhipicephalus sanguineus TaxID=34632 RepID=A0A9D4PU83_RHISA|nr:hypothetical protein HPB52_003909 [Rhipicephalus sanguineus]